MSGGSSTNHDYIDGTNEHTSIKNNIQIDLQRHKYQVNYYENIQGLIMTNTNTMRGKTYVPRYDPIEMLAVLEELQEVIEDISEITMTLLYDDDDEVLHVEFSSDSAIAGVMQGLVLLRLPHYSWA